MGGIRYRHASRHVASEMVIREDDRGGTFEVALKWISGLRWLVLEVPYCSNMIRLPAAGKNGDKDCAELHRSSYFKESDARRTDRRDMPGHRKPHALIHDRPYGDVAGAVKSFIVSIGSEPLRAGRRLQGAANAP